MSTLIVYLLKLHVPTEQKCFNFLLQFSPPEKQKRILRQRIKQNADTMAIGGALARYMLWKAFRIPLNAQIAYGEFGKPYLPDYPDAYFSISHSGAYVACAVCDRPIGIDIQVVGAYRSTVAKRVCTPEELKQIEASTDLVAEFTKLWTQKEAYLKLLGYGLMKGIKDLPLPPTETLKTIKCENTYLSYISA